MQHVDVEQDFPFPVAELFAILSDHERVGKILGAPMTRIVDGSGPGGVNGVGSVRKVGAGLLAFEETIVTCEPNELIEYEVTKGSPIKNHRGRMEMSATPSGCHLRYTIRFEGKFPGVGPLVRFAIGRSIERGLAKLAEG